MEEKRVGTETTATQVKKNYDREASRQKNRNGKIDQAHWEKAMCKHDLGDK